MRLVIRPLADADIDSAADYYAHEASLDVALSFLDALNQAFERLREHPQIGAEVHTIRPRLAGLRFWPVQGFERYLVFYLPSPDLVEVVRVLHGARDLQDLLGIEADEP